MEERHDGISMKREALENKQRKLQEIEAGAEFIDNERLVNKTSMDYWNRFRMTGSVQDFLIYRASLSGDGEPGDI